MARWFRSYVEKLHNLKVRRLSDAHYRAWDSLLCVAAMHDGLLPALADVALLLHRTPAATAKLIEALIAAGLFVRTERGIEPHDWNEWQYKSDGSAERMRRHRQRHGDVTAAVTVTDSENQRFREQSSEEPDGSSAPAALADPTPAALADPTPAALPDPVKSIFDEGVALLARTGTPARRARSIVGHWRAKARDDERVASLIREARRREITEPIAWFAKALAAIQVENDPWAGVDI